jgi:hypothetical protein
MTAQTRDRPVGGAYPRPNSGEARTGGWKQQELFAMDNPLANTFRQVLSKRLGRPRNESVGARIRRLRKILGFRLHGTVEHRLCTMDFEALKRVSNFVECVQDNILFSTPDASSASGQLRKVLRWAYSIGSYRTDSGVRQWKLFASLLKWYSLSSETPKPETPTDFPGFGPELEEEFPPFWFLLCPWLKTIVRSGAESKLSLTRIGHLTATRGMPPGDRKTRERSLTDHRSVLSHSPTVCEGRREFLFTASKLIGKKLLREADYTSQAHLSLTSSSSFDSSVKEGGRGAEVAKSLRLFLEHIPSKTVEGKTLLGRPYTKLCGFPVWVTMCRFDYMSYIQALPHHQNGGLADEVQAGESRQDTSFDFENFKYEDPLYALDEVSGYQLHQWATEELLKIGVLSGSASEPESIKFTREVYPLIRRSTIGEPGAKSRVVTVGEACLTIFLQPFSHHITGWLRCHPMATAGLTRAAQGFEYVKALHRKECPTGKEFESLMFLTSDLKAATDYCVHDYSQAMLEGLISGLGEESPYHSLSTELLCSPRVVLENGERWETHRAILMGDPGAKAVLTMHNLCAELEALLRVLYPQDSLKDLIRRMERMETIPTRWWRHFACAGDDHIAVGPKEYLQKISESHSLNGMSVSYPQNFISRVGSIYCEELLFTRGYLAADLFRGSYLWQLDYCTHIHVDVVKLRLLSPCSKEHEGKDEPNPGIGKAYQISKILAWLPDSLKPLRKWSSARFHDRFSAFLPSTYHLYLQKSLGGIEAPAWHMEETSIVDTLLSIEPVHASLIEKLLEAKSTPMDRRVLGSFATNIRARGIEADVILDHVRDFLSNEELTKAITLDELKAVIEVSSEEFRSWNVKKKLAAATAAGFISINDAINLIDRPYIFRDILYPDMSIRHGLDPYQSRSYDPLPWSVRIERFNSNLELQVPDNERNSLKLNTLRRISAAVCSDSFLEVPSTGLLIPRGVVSVESRPTLQTPYRC